MISIALKWLYEYRIRTMNEANRISSIHNNTCTMHSSHLRTLFIAVEQNIYSIAVITQITIVARFRSSFVFIFIIMTLSIYAFVISYRFNWALFCLFQAQLHSDTDTHTRIPAHTHIYHHIIIHIIFGKREVRVHIVSVLIVHQCDPFAGINFSVENMHFVRCRTRIHTRCTHSFLVIKCYLWFIDTQH